MKIVFVTLAMNQTRFFEAVGSVLRNNGNAVEYLCYHEASWEYLQEKQATAYNLFDHRYIDGKEIRIEDFNIKNINLALSHEKAAFEFKHTDRLLKKLRSYLASATTVLEECSKSGEPLVVVQELGGFLSNIATYHAARSLNIENIFLEPSFFKGRFFMVRNSFSAPKVKDLNLQLSKEVQDDVRKYLEDVIARQSIVIPSKDTHHYRKPLKKLLDLKNWRRLFEKSISKFVLGKREEFSHVVGHVWRHIRMAFNSQLLKLQYKSLPENERFIYYPLHVPADVALTLRSPEYLDQISLIDFIARSAPYPWRVVIKEHPALVGAVRLRDVWQLLRQRDNVVLLDPGTNNYDVIRKADAVITVNSKTGAEALLLQIPVVVLGDAFYRECNNAYLCDRLHDLPELIQRVVITRHGQNAANPSKFFQNVWAQSFPGELYDLDPKNISVTALSLLHYLTAQQK